MRKSLLAALTAGTILTLAEGPSLIDRVSDYSKDSAKLEQLAESKNIKFSRPIERPIELYQISEPLASSALTPAEADALLDYTNQKLKENNAYDDMVIKRFKGSGEYQKRIARHGGSTDRWETSHWAEAFPELKMNKIFDGEIRHPTTGTRRVQVRARPNLKSEGDSGLDLDVVVLYSARGDLEHYSDRVGRIGVIDGSGYTMPGRFNSDYAHSYPKEERTMHLISNSNSTYVPVLRDMFNQLTGSGKIKAP